MQDLNIKECIDFGWATCKKRFPLFIAAVSVLLLVTIVTNQFSSAATTMLGALPGGALGLLVSLVVNTLVVIGFTSLFLSAHDDVTAPTLRDLWYPKPFVQYIFASFVSTAIVLVGYLLLIIPGIILSLALCFTSLLVIDKDMDALEAMKESVRITKGNRLKLLGLFLFFLVLNVIGVLMLFVGLLVTLPVSYMAFVHAYRVLSGSETVEDVIPKEVVSGGDLPTIPV